MSNDSGAQGRSVNVVEEEDATGKVIEIYQDIKTTLGIDFVPNMYRALAVNPDYLEITWRKVQAVMGEDGKLGAMAHARLSGRQPHVSPADNVGYRETPQAIWRPDSHCRRYDRGPV